MSVLSLCLLIPIGSFVVGWIGSILYTFTFRFLRARTGGYHARTPHGCLITSVILQVLFLYLSICMPHTSLFVLVAIISGFSIVLIGPANHPELHRIGIQPDFFPMLAYSPTGAHSLSFRQMCAYIRVRVRASATLAGDTYLKSVILQGNDGEVLAGEGIRVAVAAADDASLNIRTGDPVLSVDASEQTYSAVALDLTDPDQPEGETNGSLLSQSEFTEFYIALPPQNFAKGCKLKKKIDENKRSCRGGYQPPGGEGCNVRADGIRPYIHPRTFVWCGGLARF